MSWSSRTHLVRSKIGRATEALPSYGEWSAQREDEKSESDEEFVGLQDLNDFEKNTNILDGTVVRVRLDRKATSISLLVVIGVRLLRSERWAVRAPRPGHGVLDDFTRRGLREPQFLIVDGAARLENAIAAVWDGVPVQRCTVHYAELRIMPTSAAKPAWEAAIVEKVAA